ncbi:MAG: hypothetical protein ACRDPZ_06440 [Gaiellaceae bacterium]
MNRSLVAAVALTAAIAMSAIGATALAAPTGASPFELTLEYQWTEGPSSTGTFAARAPFCDSGTSVLGFNDAWEEHRLTCDDGSGSLVVSFEWVPSPDSSCWEQGPGTTNWRILEGTGSYVSLRGKGSACSETRSEILDPDCVEVFAEWCPRLMTSRSTLQGIAGEDAIAPAIGFSSVDVTRLPRPAGAYSLALAIALRDEVEGNPVSYALRVTPTTSARVLASDAGTTQAGTVSMTMPVRYYRPRVRAVLLRLTASDEVGNESSANQVVKLPR